MNTLFWSHDLTRHHVTSVEAPRWALLEAPQIASIVPSIIFAHLTIYPSEYRLNPLHDRLSLEIRHLSRPLPTNLVRRPS